MQFNLPILRIGLYVVLILFSFVAFCLSAARVNHTNPNGYGYYEPVVAALLVAGLLTILFSLFIVYAIHKRYEHPYYGVFATEIVGLISLWFFWIIGTGIASSVLGPNTNLAPNIYCRTSSCSEISALLGFSWLSWITLSGILAITLLFSIANSAFREPLHGRWDPRQSMAVKS